MRNSDNLPGIITNFCDTFGEGYIERKNLLAPLVDIVDEQEFRHSCKQHYDESYDFVKARFDEIDFTHGKLETSTICDSLFKLKEVLI